MSHFDKVGNKIGCSACLKNLQKATAGIVRSSNALPKIGDGYELYASYTDYAKFMEQQKLRIILSMRKLLANVGCRVKLTSVELDDMEKIIYANDFLVERIANSLDEHQALLAENLITKSKLNIGAEAMVDSPISVKKSQSLGFRDGGGRYASAFGNSTAVSRTENAPSSSLWTSCNVTVKPQRAFQDLIINSDLPFVPKLVVKNNALNIIRGENLRIIDENSSNNAKENYAKPNVFVNKSNWLNEDSLGEHPYQNELNHFVVPKNQLMAPETIQDVLDLEKTPLTLIVTKEQLKQLVVELNNTTEISIDVEHHSFRSFLGLSCLVQISTKTSDYLIDPFPIWKSMHILNEPFSNPKILKILHGSGSDVIWLQRDFGIYIINIFDTSSAMRELGMQRCGLKQLLEDVCNVNIDKNLQKADWRIRPLPNDFINYARMDSHYLIYCYDQLRVRLATKDFGSNYIYKESPSIKNVFLQGIQLSSKVFEQPRLDPEGYKELLSSRRRFNNRQLFVLKQLWKWRDATAREHDESYHYVLPNHMMLQIAEILPREMQGIIACCSPVPSLLKHDLATLFKFITTARDLPLEKLEHGGLFDDNSIGFNSKNVLNDPVLEINRITKLKAKLEYYFDCTNFKADEEIPSVNARICSIKQLSNKVIVKEETDGSFMLSMHSVIDNRFKSLNKEEETLKFAKNKKFFTFVNDKYLKTHQKDIDNKLKRIYGKIGTWVTPYESYLAHYVKRAKEAEKNKNQNRANEIPLRNMTMEEGNVV